MQRRRMPFRFIATCVIVGFVMSILTQPSRVVVVGLAPNSRSILGSNVDWSLVGRLRYALEQSRSPLSECPGEQTVREYYTKVGCV